MVELIIELGALVIRLAIPEAVAMAAILAAWIGGGSLVALWIHERRRQ